MSRLLVYLFCAACLFQACDSNEDLEEEALIAGNESRNLCLPPITVDTSSVRMYMKLDGGIHRPTANFSCILPNFFLGIDQIWVNGSIPPARKVVTLMMPPEIETTSCWCCPPPSPVVSSMPEENFSLTIWML